MGTVGPTPRTTNSWVSRPDPAQNAATERRPPPSWPQRRSARRTCSRSASTPVHLAGLDTPRTGIVRGYLASSLQAAVTTGPFQ